MANRPAGSSQKATGRWSSRSIGPKTAQTTQQTMQKIRAIRVSRNRTMLRKNCRRSASVSNELCSK